MKTTPVMGRVLSARTSRNWETISHAARLRVRPSRPVAQKEQPSAHPTCEERQRVWCVSKSGMRTASTCAAVGELEEVLAEAVGGVDHRDALEARLGAARLGQVEHLAPDVARLAQRATAADHRAEDAARVRELDAERAGERRLS